MGTNGATMTQMEVIGWCMTALVVAGTVWVITGMIKHMWESWLGDLWERFFK